jgi:hypothetical protein
MVGGLLLSQALTLFTTPVVYLHLDRLSNWRKQSEITPALSGAVRRRDVATRPGFLGILAGDALDQPANASRSGGLGCVFIILGI